MSIQPHQYNLSFSHNPSISLCFDLVGDTILRDSEDLTGRVSLEEIDHWVLV